MIITVTPNPAVDQTLWPESVASGEVHRVRESHIDPGGKGINASRMAHRLGWPTIAFGFAAGEPGDIVERTLRDERVHHQLVRVAGRTRINVTIVDPGGVATSFYDRGPTVAVADVEALDELVRFWLQTGRVLVLAGSLPPGIPIDYYATLTRSARERGVAVILDADGAALSAGVRAGPAMIKPNQEEAARLLGRSLPDLDAVVAGARELGAGGVETVVVSMGPNGAVCVHGGKVWHAMPPKVERRSTVGSGDSMVAGFAVALAKEDDPVAGLRLGTAAGAATAMSRGTALGTRADVEMLLGAVQIVELR